METETPTINHAQGYTVIDRANGYITDFLIEIESKRNREKLFKEIFREDIYKHLLDKYAGYNGDFGGFYLNLDNDCWQRLLKFMFKHHPITVEYPPIPNWEQLAIDYEIDQEDRTESYMRRILLIHGKSKWELWPHDLVWIYKWMLYANNHGIDGFGYGEEVAGYFDEYDGPKFGNWKNWAAFWKWCPRSVRMRIVEKIAND